jgi:hypothetical protein
MLRGLDLRSTLELRPFQSLGVSWAKKQERHNYTNAKQAEFHAVHNHRAVAYVQVVANAISFSG